MKLLAVNSILVLLTLLTTQSRGLADEFPKQEFRLIALLEKTENGSSQQAAEVEEQVGKLRDFMARARFTPEAQERYKAKVDGLEFMAELLGKSHKSQKPIDDITLDSSQAPRIAGSGGCNRWMSSIDFHGDTFKIAGIAMTRKMCPKKGVMEMESKFSQALGQSVAWEIKGDLLVLKSKDDSTLLLFKQKDLIGKSPVP